MNFLQRTTNSDKLYSNIHGMLQVMNYLEFLKQEQFEEQKERMVQLYDYLNIKDIKCKYIELVIRIELSNGKSLSISKPLDIIDQYETAIIKDNQPVYDSKLGYDFHNIMRFDTHVEIYDEIQRIFSIDEEDESEDIIVLPKYTLG